MQDEQGNVYQVNVTQTQPTNRTPRGACYECNQVRHFARNCPNQKKKPCMATAQLVDWMTDTPTTNENPVDVLPSPQPWDFPPSIDGDISRADDPMELDDPE
jgi:hypothetical protein